MKPLTIILPLALLALPASAFVGPYSSDADTAALYHLDEATDTFSADVNDYVIADSSSNSLDLRTNARSHQSPFLGVSGPAGLGTAMTQTNERRAYRVSNVDTGLFNTETFTIEAWIRNPTLGDYPGIFRVDMYTGEKEVVQFSLDNNATTPTLRISFFDSAGGWSAYTSTETVSFEADTWYHVAVTYSGDGTGNDSELKFFFDAETDFGDGSFTRAGTQLGDTQFVDDIDPFEFGDTGDIWVGELEQAARLNGDIDEVRWSNTVRSEFNLAAPGEPDPYLVVAPDRTLINNGVFETFSIPFANAGDSTNLNLTGVTVGGTDAAFFSNVIFDTGIVPGDNGTIRLDFTPTVSGLYTITLTIESNDPLNGGTMVVNMDVLVADPNAVVTPDALDYGIFDPAPPAQTLDVTIANHGGGTDLAINDITVFDDPDGVFSVGSYPLTVAPNGSIDVTITFAPGTLEGFFSGTLEITTDGANQAFFTLPLSAVVALANPDASLVSHFTFEDGGNIGDDTGSFDNDGIPVGDAQQTSSARIGVGALLLDGDGDLIDLGVGTGADYTDQLIANFEGFTVACWAFVPADTVNDVSRFFSSYMPGGWTTEGWGAGHVTSDRLLATAYGKVDYHTIAGSAPLRGAWHHFAYVFRNDPIDTVDYYVDGVMVESQTRTQTGLNPATTVGFAIGALGNPAGGNEQYFDGLIDDLRIYDRELVMANISDIHTAAPPLSPYDDWAAFFGLDPAGDGAPEQDAEGDGLNNAIEFLLGSSPVSGVQTNLPAGDRSGDDFIVVYQRKTAATNFGVDDSVEYSSDLVGWTTAVHNENGVTISVLGIDADTEEVTVTIPAAGQAVQFARVVVAAP